VQRDAENADNAAKPAGQPARCSSCPVSTNDIILHDAPDSSSNFNQQVPCRFKLDTVPQSV
jgi:hypothetical protein